MQADGISTQSKMNKQEPRNRNDEKNATPSDDLDEQPPASKQVKRKKKGKQKSKSFPEMKSKNKQPKKRGAPKKDPTAPKRPLPAFLAFSNSKKADLKQKNPSLTNKDLSQMLAKEWKSLPEPIRQKYRFEEHSKMADYRARTEAWRKQKQKGLSSTGEPKQRDGQQETEATQHPPNQMTSLPLSSRVRPTDTSAGAAALSQASAMLPGVGATLGKGLGGPGGPLILPQALAAAPLGLVGSDPSLQSLPSNADMGQQLLQSATVGITSEGGLGEAGGEGHHLQEQEQEQRTNTANLLLAQQQQQHLLGGLMNAAVGGSVNPLLLLQDQSSALSQQAQNQSALQSYLLQQQQQQQSQQQRLFIGQQTTGQIPLLGSGNTTASTSNLLGQTAQGAHGSFNQTGTQLVVPTTPGSVMSHNGGVVAAGNPLNSLVQQQLLLQQPGYALPAFNLSYALPTDSNAEGSTDQQAASFMLGGQLGPDQL